MAENDRIRLASTMTNITVDPNLWNSILSNVPIYSSGYSPAPREQTRTVFVGYPYRIPAEDYRPVFESVGEEYDVTFVFADAELTNKHILEKIAVMISAADFSLFDITYWNPNVALELGIAYGRGLDYYILFDPTKEATDVLADLRGIDRIEYRTYAQLRDELANLMRDQFGAPEQEQPSAPGSDVMERIDAMRAHVPEILAADPGQPIGGIASRLGVSIELAQTVVRPLVGRELETRGVRRGMKYYVTGDAPPEEEDEEAPVIEAEALPQFEPRHTD
jgi:hypothetical protein